jgi:hypothetical protein
MKKIGNRPITEADTNFFKDVYQKLGFWEVSRGFAVSRTGTVGSTEHWVKVPKCLHKIPKFIKNSYSISR